MTKARRRPALPWDKLFELASATRQRAYAPYSNLKIGAAVLTSDGKTVGGCNLENASYGLSICAERNAVGQAVARAGKIQILAMAIVADTPEPCPPCGMCRQTLIEFANASLPIRTRNLRGQQRQYTLGDLLPHAFTGQFL
jgi:cytidine deaminase